LFLLLRVFNKVLPASYVTCRHSNNTCWFSWGYSCWGLDGGTTSHGSECSSSYTLLRFDWCIASW
jgi:hypothetical protein